MHKGYMERKKLDEGIHTAELTSAFRVGAIAGQVQVLKEILREITGHIGNVAGFNGAAGQFLETGRVVSQFADKSHNQRIPTQAQLFKVNEVKDFPRKVGQQVVMEAKRTQ